MSTSFYDLSVGSFLQTVSGMQRVLAKGAEFAKDNNIDPDTFVNLKIHDSMLPMLFQVACVPMHSVAALEAIKGGVFTPPKKMEPSDYQGLIDMVDKAHTQLSAYSEDEVNALAGKPVMFKMDSMEIPFTAENFVMSFSLPNLNFHAATAYDLLRAQGVALEKIDFLGKMRIGI